MSVEAPTNVNRAPFDRDTNPKLIDEDKVDKVTLSDFGLTPEAIKAYMFGIRVLDESTGQEMGDKFYWQILQTQIAKVQDELDIQIMPMVVRSEKHDYYDNDTDAYNHIDLFKRPVLQMDKFRMDFGNAPILDFTPDMWKIYNLEGQVEIVPLNYMQLSNGGGSMLAPSSQLAQLALNQYISYPLYYGQNSAPQAYVLDYVAGMLPPKRVGVVQDWEMPADLQELIIYECLNQIFMVWGRLLGVGAGIASKKLSIDDVSQEITTTQTAMYTGSRADIDVINMQIDKLTNALQNRYGHNYTSI